MLPLASFGRRTVGFALDELVVGITTFTTWRMVQAAGATPLDASATSLLFALTSGAALIHLLDPTMGMAVTRTAAVDRVSGERLT